MNKFFILIGGVIVIGVVGWLAMSQIGQDQAVNSVGDKEIISTESTRFDKAPNFSLNDYSGNTVNLSDFQGTPLLVNSWAAWCPFCLRELQDFSTIQKEFNNQLVIIAIDRAESLSVAKNYSDDIGVTDDLIFLLDPSDSFYRSIGGFSMPETIFVNKDGDIVEHKRGPMTEGEIRIKVKEFFDL